MASAIETRPMRKGFALRVEFPGQRALDWMGRRPALGLRAALAAGHHTSRDMRYSDGMSPTRKRTLRLVAALSAAVLRASALVYTSFSAASPALTPSQLVRKAQPGRSYQLTGTVLSGSVYHQGSALHFSVRDRTGGTAVPVA